MKILSFHPFSLYENGGGNRILRRIYQGREKDVTSLVVSGTLSAPKKGEIKEIIVKAEPINRKWAKWYLRKWLIGLRMGFFKPFTIRHIREAAAQISYDVIHVVSHGTFSTALCTDEFRVGKQLWVSFHDHYNATLSSFEDSATLWRDADRILVICKEMGIKYAELFGARPYEIITDGVTEKEIRPAKKIVEMPVSIYFAGLLHLHYMPLFKIMANALDLLKQQNLSFKLILRGTQNLEFLNGRSFETEYRPMTLDNAELKEEMDFATILYLPIKFTTPDFYLYSLSTKMVGYLGAPGCILYHGPLDSAASQLLKRENAAICCGSLAAAELAESIKLILSAENDISGNAKKLAQTHFNMREIQQRFWLDNR